MLQQRETTKVNVLGFICHSESSSDPFRIDRDGHPYLPTGDGGIVLNYLVGESVFALDADHAAPGVSLSHPNQDAAYSLVAQSCIGNLAKVRTGEAAGSLGVVLGKRGEGGRVIVIFKDDVMKKLKPDDQITITTEGQGQKQDGMETCVLNIATPLLNDLKLKVENEKKFRIPVRTIFDSRLVGNGIGRPMPLWDVDLQIYELPVGVSALKIGDLVAISNLDARYNSGYRKDWISVGVLIHGSSPQPGHGPGVTIFLSGPAHEIEILEDPMNHVGLTLDSLFSCNKKLDMN